MNYLEKEKYKMGISLPVLKRPPPRGQQTSRPKLVVQIQQNQQDKAKEDHQKRGFRALLDNLPHVIGKDPRFPTPESTHKYIVEMYKEKFNEVKTFGEIYRWAKMR